jgi:hypothetical protein
MPVERAGELGQRDAYGRHQHLRHRQIGDGIALGDHDRGTPPDRVRNELAAVLLEARHRDETRARLDAARIARDRRHRARRIADHALLRQRREELAHGRARHVTWRSPTRSA